MSKRRNTFTEGAWIVEANDSGKTWYVYRLLGFGYDFVRSEDIAEAAADKLNNA